MQNYSAAEVAEWTAADDFADSCQQGDDESLAHAATLQNVFDVDGCGRSRLHCAAYFSRFAACEILLQRGSAFNLVAATDQWCNTPLHCAVFENQDQGVSASLAVVAALIAAGAEVDAANIEGATPLMTCTSKSVVAKLIGAGADVTRRDIYGRTVLHFAASTPTLTGLIPLLLSYGLEVDVSDNTGCTPLMMSESQDALELLLNAGADGKRRDQCGMTALHYAVSFPARENLIPILLSHAVDIDAQDKQGCTPLMLCQGPATIRILLESGADVFKRIGSGRTVLHHVASMPSLAEFIPALLERGMEVDKFDEWGSSPLSVCKSTAAIHHLLDGGAIVPKSKRMGCILHQFVLDKSLSSCLPRLLVVSGVDMVLRTNRDRQNILHCAASAGNEEAIWVLLQCEHAAKLVGKKDVRHLTPLHILAGHNASISVDLILQFVDAGADLDAIAINETDVRNNRFHSRRTPLHCAIEGGHTDTIGSLLTAGAHLSSVARMGDEIHNCLSAGILQGPVRQLILQTLLRGGGDHSVDYMSAMRWVLSKCLRGSMKLMSIPERLQIVTELVNVGADFGADMPTDLLLVTRLTKTTAGSQASNYTLPFVHLLAKSGGQWTSWKSSREFSSYVQGRRWGSETWIYPQNQDQNEDQADDEDEEQTYSDQCILSSTKLRLTNLHGPELAFLLATGVITSDAVLYPTLVKACELVGSVFSFWD